MSDRTNTIREELLALRNPNGLINPAAAVQWAKRNKKSALHSALTWDDGVAADRYRVWEVRELIAIHIVDAHGGRQFVALSIDRPTGGYRPINEVMARVDLREVMLADALDELKRVQTRFNQLTELSEVWQAADKVSERLRKPKAA
jgi:hypothetical protein